MYMFSVSQELPGRGKRDLRAAVAEKDLALAENDVAMRVIDRSAFEPVYAKVWARTGIRGNLIEFLGPPLQQ